MKKYLSDNKLIKLKINFISITMIIIFAFILLYTFKIMIIDKEKYEELLYIKTSKIYKGSEAPRGNIYDRNGILLVGNESIPIIKYTKTNLTNEEEIKLATRVAENIKIDYTKVNENMLKEYIYNTNKEELLGRITEKVKKQYENRKITNQEYKEIILDNITEEEINVLNEEEKATAYIYYIMNLGYRYEDKIIKNKEVTEEEIKYIENEPNLYIDYIYERTYPYGDTLKNILGNVGSIQEEDLEQYLEQGYFRNDLVGTSYLEEEYESYLKGTPYTYRITSDGKRETVTEMEKGNDLYLTIDINLQVEIEKIVEEQMIKTKGEPNTTYFNKNYIIIGNAYDGSIYAFVGKMITYNGKYNFIDNSLGLITDAITPGSSIKGASHLVGYSTGAITYGQKITDGCIKIKNTDEKCSWKNLGVIDDLEALKYSSNYYQFVTAIKIGKGNYRYNAPLILDKNGFETYRKIFNGLGLGIKTGIDLPYESTGFKGNDEYVLSLLDFPIGQYDNYTPIQMFQYISTIYNNGTRVAPHLANYIKNDTETIYEYKRNVVGGVNVKEQDFLRVKEGLKMVMESGGTGYGYINLKYNPIGKTGTAQSFIDTNMDGKIDTETVSKAFVGIADDITFVVLSPSISDRKTSYTSSSNKKLSKTISDLYFEKYKKTQ